MKLNDRPKNTKFEIKLKKSERNPDLDLGNETYFVSQMSIGFRPLDKTGCLQ